MASLQREMRECQLEAEHAKEQMSEMEDRMQALRREHTARAEELGGDLQRVREEKRKLQLQCDDLVMELEEKVSFSLSLSLSLFLFSVHRLLLACVCFMVCFMCAPFSWCVLLCSGTGAGKMP